MSVKGKVEGVSKMKRKLRVVFMLFCFVMMLCVWPFCVVRKEVVVTSALNVGYGYTEPRITYEHPYSQRFIAQTAKLEKIMFVVGYDVEKLPEAGVMHFELLDADNEIIVSKNVNFSEIINHTFCDVSINKWISQGEEYIFRLSVEKQYDNLFYGIYTLEPEHHAPGSRSLVIGDFLAEGQGLAGYEYGYPLNIKNVMCLWGFLLTIGLSSCSLLRISYIGRRKESTKLRMIWNKVWTLLERHERFFLIAEMCTILFMIVLICRNRAVDWDEAYSIQMITKYSFFEMFRITAKDIHPPLYYVLLRLFSMFFGTSVFALKLMSVVFTGFTMLLGVIKVRKNWGGYAAFLFNLVVGLGPQFLFYSVNIRMYSMSLFFVMWCALLAYDIIQGKGKGSWVLFAISALGGAYTHYFNVVPLAFVCGYLMVGLIISRKKECKYFFCLCVGIVLGYLPWLSVVISSFQREGSTGQIDLSTLNFGELIEWAFSTNVKFSECTPVILFLFAVLIFVVEWKKIFIQDKLFLGMCALNLLFSYVVCRTIASMNQHFWNDRYVFSALGTFWLFLVIIYSQRGRVIVCTATVWLSIMVLSSFVINVSMELGTNAYMNETYEVLEQVREEEIILYNYDTYDVLYSSHLREQQFVDIDDFDWENYEKEYVYFISWGGHLFSDEVYQKYQLKLLDCGTMRFEEGVAGVKLYKVLKSAPEQ